MKLYVSADMEGITGLPDETFVDCTKHNYESSRQIMTDEVNAIIRAAVQSGVQEILVNDSHSKMNNLLVERLDPVADLLIGGMKTLSMMHGIDETYDGVLFVGYHARAGQPGVMSHSMTFSVRTMWIDEVEVGEIGLNAYVAGYFGVPVLLVSGDDQACKEAEELLPGVVTAVVKQSISRSAVKTMHPTKAQRLLTEKTMRAIEQCTTILPLQPPKHPRLRVEFTNYGQAEWASLLPGAIIERGTTIVSYQADNIIEAYQAMLVMIELAMRVKYC